jgi:pimeloyl-ACP methyl ester carboxylesterase
MHYRDMGEGTPLLLLHGFFENGELWAPFTDPLSKQYRLLVPDLRGHGRSTNPSKKFTFEQSAADIIALLDHLNVKSCMAMGHSGGGMTLLHVALKQPKRLTSMVLDGASHNFSKQMRQTIAKSAEELKDNEGFFAHVSPWHERGKAQVRDLLEQFAEFSRTTGMKLTSKELESIKVRTLVVLGDRDEFVPVETAVMMHRLIPNSRLWIVPGRRHDLTYNENMPFVDVTSKFLKGRLVDN